MDDRLPFETDKVFLSEDELIEFLNDLIVVGSWASLVLNETNLYHPSLYKIMVESIHDFCARYREELKEMAADQRIIKD